MKRDLRELRAYATTEAYRIIKDCLERRLEELRAANDAAPLSEIRGNQAVIKEIKRTLQAINI